MRPIPTKRRFESTRRFTTACGPAAMMRQAPRVGTAAHAPGKALASVTTAKAMRPMPTQDIASARRWVWSSPERSSFAYASNPPAVNSHNRENGA